MIDLSKFKPGLMPVGPRLLVLPEPIKDTTDGGIALPGLFTEKEEMKQMKALVIDMGFEAYSDTVDNWCEPGEEILMARYAGVSYEGDDKRKYRLILDSDVVAVINHDNDPLAQVCCPVGIASQEGVHNG